MLRLRTTPAALFTLCGPLLAATVAGCTPVDAQPLGDGVTARSDNGAFMLHLEATAMDEDTMDALMLTVAMPNPGDPTSMDWVIPGAVVSADLFHDGELIASVSELRADRDGHHALEGLPTLAGEGPWTFEFQVDVDQAVLDTAVVHVTR